MARIRISSRICCFVLVVWIQLESLHDVRDLVWTWTQSRSQGCTRYECSDEICIFCMDLVIAIGVEKYFRWLQRPPVASSLKKVSSYKAPSPWVIALFGSFSLALRLSRKKCIHLFVWVKNGRRTSKPWQGLQDDRCQMWCQRGEVVVVSRNWTTEARSVDMFVVTTR